MDDLISAGEGECDRCHREPVRLFMLDDDDPAGWAFCARCIPREVRREAAGLRRRSEIALG